jgi:arginyl-tRNA synthetase
MSTRKGDVVLLEDFINDAVKKAKKKAKKEDYADKIAISAVKYSILKNNPNKSILFNLDDALNFEGDTGPYLLYSYARASSILKKVKEKHEIEEQEEKIGELEKTAELIKKLSQFPEIVLKAYNELNPSYIANYSYELAKVFNEFYHLSRVIGSKDEALKIQLVNAFRQVMKNSLSLLGISVIEEM